MLLEVLGFLVIKEIGKSINTQVGKTNADKFGVYRDGNGSYRLIQNGRKVYDSFDKNGDAIYKYANNGLTAINMSLIEAEQNEEMAKKCGNRFYLRQRTSSLTPLGNKSIKGIRYCETGKSKWICYVERSFMYRDENNREYYGTFYMDMNYKLYCPTEYTVNRDKQTYKELVEKDMLHDGIILSSDNTELYNKIIEAWNSSNILHELANTNSVRIIGHSTKGDYKDVYDRIARRERG